MKVICNQADESCGNCTHAIPHKLISTKGPEPKYGYCQPGHDYCFTKPCVSCKCIEITN